MSEDFVSSLGRNCDEHSLPTLLQSPSHLIYLCVMGTSQNSKAIRTARFAIGQVVRHRLYPFRGVIYDVDPEFANTEAWWRSIPEDARPRRDQPFYHLLAENDDGAYVAYVSEQNLLLDDSGDPVDHPQIEMYFGTHHNGYYTPLPGAAN